MRRTALHALLLLAVTAGTAQADTITLGMSGGAGLPWPFGSGTRVQQVFDSTLFSGTWDLTAITFYNRDVQSSEGYVEPTTYHFSLSTTPTSSATLATNYDANVGPSAQPVLDWTVTGYTTAFFDTLTLTFATPFSFDPRHGNLLLDIRKDSSSEDGDGPIYVDGSVSGISGISLAANTVATARGTTNSDNLMRNGGMLVSFNGTTKPFDRNPAPVPEPASMLLITAGLAGAYCTRRLRS
jgi:hypothetical protein